MIKAEIVDKISQRIGIEKMAVKMTIESFMESVKDAQKRGEEVSLRGFGTFKIKKKNEKNFHAAPGKWILIPEHNEPSFKPCKDFKEQVRISAK